MSHPTAAPTTDVVAREIAAEQAHVDTVYAELSRASYGGVVNTMPRFTAFALFFAMANCGFPGTAGFVGEWMVILVCV